MPRPTTKAELLLQLNLCYDKLLEMIDSMSPTEMETEFDFSADDKKKEAH